MTINSASLPAQELDELEVFRVEWREELRRKQQQEQVSPEKVPPQQAREEEVGGCVGWRGHLKRAHKFK